MGNIKARFDKIVSNKGPDRVTVPIAYEGETEDYTFRVLPFIELDKLRVAPFGPRGMDPAKMVGNNVRWIVATLVDDDGSAFHADFVETLPTNLIDKLADAARKANRVDETVETAAKNSESAATGI